MPQDHFLARSSVTNDAVRSLFNVLHDASCDASVVLLGGYIVVTDNVQ